MPAKALREDRAWRRELDTGLEWIREKVVERGIKMPEWPDKAGLLKLY